jgi:hypothetical protein
VFDLGFDDVVLIIPCACPVLVAGIKRLLEDEDVNVVVDDLTLDEVVEEDWAFLSDFTTMSLKSSFESSSLEDPNILDIFLSSLSLSLLPFNCCSRLEEDLLSTFLDTSIFNDSFFVSLLDLLPLLELLLRFSLLSDDFLSVRRDPSSLSFGGNFLFVDSDSLSDKCRRPISEESLSLLLEDGIVFKDDDIFGADVCMFKNNAILQKK